MIEVTSEDRLVQLESLLEVLAEEIDNKPGARDLAQLARQYRETLREIEEIKGMGDSDDEISKILSSREADGKSNTVR